MSNNRKQEPDEVFQRKNFRLDLQQALIDARTLTREAKRLPLSVGWQDRARQAWERVQELCKRYPVKYEKELQTAELEIQRHVDAIKLAEETL